MRAMSNITILLLALLLLCPSFIAGQEEEDEVQSKIKHPAKNVVERKLVVEKINTKLVLKENKNYAQDTTKRNFRGDSIVYVTPWYTLHNLVLPPPISTLYSTFLTIFFFHFFFHLFH